MKNICKMFIFVLIILSYHTSIFAEENIDTAKEYFLQKEYYKAKNIYEKLASQDDIEALNMLGCMYILGKGVRENITKGLDLCGRACDKGSSAGCDNYNRYDTKFSYGNLILIQSSPSALMGLCTSK